MEKKSKYRTVSIPTGLTDEIQKIMNEFRYWPSVSAFVREATLEKVRKIRDSDPFYGKNDEV